MAYGFQADFLTAARRKQGVPLITGAGFGWVKQHYSAIAAVSGALMVAVGVLLFTGQFTRLVAPLAKNFQLGL